MLWREIKNRINSARRKIIVLIGILTVQLPICAVKSH